MAIGKRGKKLGIQLRDEEGKTYWAKDGNGDTLTFPDTKEGREHAQLVERQLVLDRDKLKRQLKLDPKRVRDGKVLVEDYFVRWKRVYARPKRSTNVMYEAAIKTFVDRYGHRPMDSIQRFEAVDFAAESPWRISALRAMFSDAAEEGVVKTNVFSKLPGERARAANGGTRRRKPRENMIILTKPEVDQLVECALEVHGDAYGPIYGARIIVAAYSALRPGELDALIENDIDFERRRIIIPEQFSNHSQEYTESKGEKPGQRTAPPECALLEPAAEALRKLPGYVNAYFGGEDPGTIRLFMTKQGRPFTARTRGFYWDPVRKAFGRPEMDFYELRHFCATWLLEQGFPSYVVAAQLRHKDNGRLVEDRYGHPATKAALDAIIAGTDQAPAQRQRRRKAVS